MATYTPVWLGNTPDYESDAYIRLWIDGHSGNTNTEVQRIYISRWNQADNTWGADSRHDTQEFNYGSPGTTVANRLYRWRARGWRSDSGYSDYSYSNYVATTPRAPINQSAGLAGPNAINLSWADGCYEPYYPYETEIWWSVNGGAWGHYTTVAAGTTSYAFSGLTPGATYQFGVRHLETNNRNLPGGLSPTLGSAFAYTGTLTATNVPATPGAITATRNSDAQATLSWANNSNGGAPYDSLTLQRWDNVGNAWATIANLSGGATSATDAGLVAGRKYQWRILANNAVGSSDWSYSGNVFTTPQAVGNAQGLYVGGTTIRATWANNVSYSEYSLRVQAYKNGVADGAVVTLGSGVTSYDKTGVTNTATYYFRIWAVSDVGALASSTVDTNTVQAAAAPNAPTGLTASPGSTLDKARTHSISWTHSPSTDGSGQTKYEIQHRLQGTSTWTAVTAVTSSVSSRSNPFTSYTNGQTVEWQVRTWGVHANPSPWSATSTVITSTTPTVTITGPASTISTSVITAAWSYFDQENSAQSQWLVDLFDNYGNLIETQSGTGTATSVTMTTAAEDTKQYRIEVTVRDAAGLWSDRATKTFTAAFKPPAEVLLLPELDGPSGAAVLTMTRTPDDAGATKFPASSVTIERRFYDPEAETYGAWEVLADKVSPDFRLIDTTAPTHDDGEYRITAHSNAPSSYRSSTIYKPDYTLDNRWLYVSGGPSFTVVCKMWANIEIEQTASRTKALHYFAGRKNPVIYSGEMAERTYSVSGILEDEASNPNEWIRLARQSGPVLLRAPGRRMYGSLSEVSIERIQHNLHKVSFSIQEVAI